MDDDTDLIERSACANGALSYINPYVLWSPGEALISLDGDFSATDLRAIAEHMDRLTKPAE